MSVDELKILFQYQDSDPIQLFTLLVSVYERIAQNPSVDYESLKTISFIAFKYLLNNKFNYPDMFAHLEHYLQRFIKLFNESQKNQLHTIYIKLAKNFKKPENEAIFSPDLSEVEARVIECIGNLQDSIKAGAYVETKDISESLNKIL